MTSSEDPRHGFLETLRRWQRGSISRRHFLGTTGLGAAAASLAAALPELAAPRRAAAAAPGATLRLATWANYHDPRNFEAFAKETGVEVATEIFTSDDEMLAHLKSGRTGWDVIVAGDCRIQAYVQAGLLQPLLIALIPSFQPQHYVDQSYAKPGIVNGRFYGVQKNWGTTGFCVDTGTVEEPMTGWRDFWDLARGKLTRRVTVEAEPLALVGNALKFYGYSFASNDEKELAAAELLLLDAKEHLLGVTDDPQPALRSGEASAAMAGTGDAEQLHKDIPSITYVVGARGRPDLGRLLRRAERRAQSGSGSRLDRFPAEPDSQSGRGPGPWLCRGRRTGAVSPAAAAPGRPDHVPRGRTPAAPRIRRRGVPDQSAPGADHGPIPFRRRRAVGFSGRSIFRRSSYAAALLRRTDIRPAEALA